MSQPDPSCLFCRIVAGQIPATRVFEDDAAIAFLDIQPVNLGHVLLVARDHHATVSDLTDDLAAHLGSVLPRLARAVVAATGAEGLNVVINNGEVAGQTIHHGHWHLIPRFGDDAVRWPWPHQSYPDGELEQIRDRIIADLSR